MKKLFPILAIVLTMAFGSVNASTNTNMNTTVTTIVSPVQDDAAGEQVESLGFLSPRTKKAFY